MTLVILFSGSSPATSSEPGVFWTQWTGQSLVSYDSEALSGLIMVAEEVKGTLFGEGWLEAKEM
jgi:hypothetical protein